MRRLAISIICALLLLAPAGVRPVGAIVGSNVAVGDAALDATTLETDILSATLLHDTEVFATVVTDTLAATLSIGGTIAAPGALLPMSGAVTGARYMVLFNNTSKQLGRPVWPSGCTKATGGGVFDFQGHWGDGFYNFLAIDARLGVAGWTYRPQIGWYDPTQAGSYRFIDLASEPAMAGRYTLAVTPGTPSTLRLEVAAKVTIQEPLCTGGVFSRDYASNGDTIANVFGLTTAETAPAPPATAGVPGSDFGPEDRQPVVPAFSDWTTRTAAMGGGSVYLPGTTGIDTFGPGPMCWTETWGGLLPSNPLVPWPPAPCYLDDGDIVNREFRFSGHGFVF